MRSNRVGGLLAAIGVVAGACSSSSSSSNTGTAASAPVERGAEVVNGPPINLPITSRDVPRTGLCRVFVVESGRIASSNDFGCNNIEQSVPLGSYIMFRSSANRNEAYLCRMSDGFPGVIDGIDIYSIARMNLVRVALPLARRDADNTMRCADAEGM